MAMCGHLESASPAAAGYWWAVLALLLTVPVTHGLGGRLRHGDEGWRFWQPFRGGVPFVLAQAVAWAVYGDAAVLVISVALIGLKWQPATLGGSLPLLVCVLGFVAEAIVMFSLFLYSSEQPLAANSPPTDSANNFQRWRRIKRPSSANVAKSNKTNLTTKLSVALSLTAVTLSCGLCAALDVYGHKRWTSAEPSSQAHFLIMTIRKGASGIVDFPWIKEPGAMYNVLCATVALGCATAVAVSVLLTHGLLGGSHMLIPVQSTWHNVRLLLMQVLVWALLLISQVSFLTAFWSGKNILGTGVFTLGGVSGLTSEISLLTSLLLLKFSDVGGNKASVSLEQIKPSALPTPDTLLMKRGADLLEKSLFPSLENDALDDLDKSSLKVGKILEEKEAVVGQEKETPREYLSEIIEPSYWTEKQKALARLGPFKFRDKLSIRDYLWYAFRRARSLVILTAIYANHFFLDAFLLLPWFVLSGRTAFPIYFTLIAIYLPTYFGSPQSTGWRTWKLMQRVWSQVLEETAVLHFGTVKVIRDSEQPLSPSQRYVFGYHPHGLFPATMSWFTLTRAWRTLLSGIEPIGLVASVVLYVPFLRDLNLWAGVREITRKTFASSLRERGSVIMCPGGQSELSYHRSGDMTQITLCSRKKGFVRLAMEAGAHLVPVLCFGESFLFDNLFDWPAAQRYTYRRIGFPIPFVPVGFLRFLPLPRARGFTIVVGTPIKPIVESLSPSDEEVERVRAQYYDALGELFKRHCNTLPGFENVKLVLKLERV